MNIKIATVFTTLGDIRAAEDSQSRMLLCNPMATDDSDVCRISGAANGQVIGSETVFRVAICADDVQYDAFAGSGLNVDPAYRSSGYALELCDLLNNLSHDKIAVGYGLSQKSRKLYRVMGAAVFDIARFAIILRSRFFLKTYKPKYDKLAIVALSDVVCFLHRIVVGLISRVATQHFRIEKVSALDKVALEDYAAMIASDPCRFYEKLNAACLKWMLEHDFGSSESADKRLYRVWVGNERIGYFITRYSKEGRLGCIVDWQINARFAKSEPWILIRAMGMLFPKADAVVVAVSKSEERSTRLFKRILIPCPDQVSVVAVGDGSPIVRHEGWREQKNWRIRPSMGDGAFY